MDGAQRGTCNIPLQVGYINVLVEYNAADMYFNVDLQINAQKYFFAHVNWYLKIGWGGELTQPILIKLHSTLLNYIPLNYCPHRTAKRLLHREVVGLG